MVHAIHLGGGRAHSYRDRWLRTDRMAWALGGLPPRSPGAVHAEPLAMKNAPMMPAFSPAEPFAVLYDLPVTFDPEAAAAGSSAGVPSQGSPPRIPSE